MLSVSVIIDDHDIVSAALQRANVGAVKELTIVLIPQVHNEHDHHLCGHMHQKGEFPPLLWCLPLRLSLMLTHRFGKS